MGKKEIVLAFLFSVIVFLVCVRSVFFDVDAEQQKVVDFIFGKADLKEGFSKAEVEHLVEVKSIVFIGKIFLWVLLVLFCVGLLFVEDRKAILFYGGIFGAIFLLVIFDNNIFAIRFWNNNRL